MTRFPFESRPGVALDPEQAALFRRSALVPVRIFGNHPALLVTGHADVRTVLSDPRFSRQQWHGGTMFARSADTLALATTDAPLHTRRRRSVQAAFTHRAAEADRPWIERIAEDLLDAVAAKPGPVDLVATYLRPLPYLVVGRIMGTPDGDVDQLVAWTDVMMSAGRCEPDEVTAATAAMHGYFRDRLDTGFLATLAPALSEQEIVVMAAGLVMAGGDATASHLSSCVHHLLHDDELRRTLIARPDLIPAAVEELLRWVWFAGTGGQPHVLLADAELAGVPLPAGQVVIPLTDAANRDPAVFSDPDEFRLDRPANPHLGFGHGRHMCVGAPHARVELRTAIGALLRRFPDLHAAPDPNGPAWRDKMFLRGLWRLPVHLR
ncbi:cytochrome P450 [Dactylosporangium fulvum]|uniref:Cytochrome P450 n=1 Tax=Dactylosporangium fulvum TaxID=53359 RepID=A0ABY5VUD2_9ACTN|nr:cytochrome P450 [Dactylosporangium fulvum]UWP80429.1 cytochrome P450 [Dactylosporangium fulvum]